MLVSVLNGYWFKTTARTFLRHVKVQIKEIVIIFEKNIKFDLVWWWNHFFQIFHFTSFLNDFISSDLHEYSYEVLTGKFILGNETMNVAKTGQFLHDIRADSLKYGREPLMLGVSDLSFKI